MKPLKFFIITLIIIFSGLTSITKAETLKFASATYEGEVKNGKANGVGIFTFSDGSIYEGKVKKIKFMVKENIQTLREMFMRESLGTEHLSLK